MGRFGDTGYVRSADSDKRLTERLRTGGGILTTNGLAGAPMGGFGLRLRETVFKFLTDRAVPLMAKGPDLTGDPNPSRPVLTTNTQEPLVAAGIHLNALAPLGGFGKTPPAWPRTEVEET